MIWLFGVGLWILLCILVAVLARSVGRNYGRYLALSLLLSPIVGAIILAIATLARPAERPGHRQETPEEAAATDAQVAEWVRRLGGTPVGLTGERVEFKELRPRVCQKCRITHPGSATHCQKCGAPL